MWESSLQVHWDPLISMYCLKERAATSLTYRTSELPGDVIIFKLKSMVRVLIPRRGVLVFERLPLLGRILEV